MMQIADTYLPPKYLFNGTLQTIVPYTLRSKNFPYFRERIETLDDDFIDLDWSKVDSQSLVILCHGFEGSSKSHYMVASTKLFNENGFDIVAFNYRGCSGEMNRQYRAYNSGDIDELAFVIKHVAKKYKKVFLVGFSLGANLVLKYLATAKRISKKVIAGVAISPPIDLKSSSLCLLQKNNKLYHDRFLRSLMVKIKQKSKMFPQLKLQQKINATKNLLDFDHNFTGPMFGYKNAWEYYEQASSLNHLHKIKKPSLIISADNDSFLGRECYPEVDSTFITTYYTQLGGHVGWPMPKKLKGASWAELKALEFLVENASLM